MLHLYFLITQKIVFTSSLVKHSIQKRQLQTKTQLLPAKYQFCIKCQLYSLFLIIIKSPKMSNIKQTAAHQNIMKPFIIKDNPSPSASMFSQSLFSTSNIFLSSMALQANGIVWGSQVEVSNPKTGKKLRVYALNKDGIKQNCIECDSSIREELGAKMGDRILVGIINKNSSREKQVEEEAGEGAKYSYEKNQYYELISHIIKGKLKIQLKVLRGWNTPKTYFKQFRSPIKSHSLASIIKFLQGQENYRVYPEQGLIQIITPEGEFLNLQLIEFENPKTIDTEVIMAILGQINNKVNDGISRFFSVDPSQTISQKARADRDTQSVITQKPADQKTMQTAESEMRDMSFDPEPQIGTKKASTMFKPSNNPKYFPSDSAITLQLRDEIEKLKKKMEIMSKKLGNQGEEQSQEKAKKELEKAALDLEMEQKKTIEGILNKFDMERRIGQSPKQICLKFTSKINETWSQISPHLFEELATSRQKIKIIKTNHMQIFIGLIKKDLFKENSSWKNQGTIGCFMGTSKVLYGGKQVERNNFQEQPLAKEGDIVEFKINKLFKEVIWVVNEREKIKIKIPELFKAYDPVSDWRCYVQTFEQGECIEFICQKN